MASSGTTNAAPYIANFQAPVLTLGTDSGAFSPSDWSRLTNNFVAQLTATTTKFVDSCFRIDFTPDWRKIQMTNQNTKFATLGDAFTIMEIKRQIVNGNQAFIDSAACALFEKHTGKDTSGLFEFEQFPTGEILNDSQRSA